MKCEKIKHGRIYISIVMFIWVARDISCNLNYIYNH